MSKHNSIGQLGEEMARKYLEENGYAILATNWRQGHHEIDIIAYYEGTVAFVEVKTRSSREYGDPEDFVDKAKQRAYVRMANRFMSERREELEEARFDIISVTIGSSGYHLEHLRDAFSSIDV